MPLAVATRATAVGDFIVRAGGAREPTYFVLRGRRPDLGLALPG
jgi:hypothetical protein